MNNSTSNAVAIVPSIINEKKGYLESLYRHAISDSPEAPMAINVLKGLMESHNFTVDMVMGNEAHLFRHLFEEPKLKVVPEPNDRTPREEETLQQWVLRIPNPSMEEMTEAGRIFVERQASAINVIKEIDKEEAELQAKLAEVQRKKANLAGQPIKTGKRRIVTGNAAAQSKETRAGIKAVGAPAQRLLSCELLLEGGRTIGEMAKLIYESYLPNEPYGKISDIRKRISGLKSDKQNNKGWTFRFDDNERIYVRSTGDDKTYTAADIGKISRLG